MMFDRVLPINERGCRIIIAMTCALAAGGVTGQNAPTAPNASTIILDPFVLPSTPRPLGAGGGPGQNPPPAPNASTIILDPVVVTATRSAEGAFDLPIAIDTVDRDRIQNGQLQVNLSESLAGIPGVSIQNRWNYAQDLQLSIRGFGAR